MCQSIKGAYKTKLASTDFLCSDDFLLGKKEHLTVCNLKTARKRLGTINN